MLRTLVIALAALLLVGCGPTYSSFQDFTLLCEKDAPGMCPGDAVCDAARGCCVKPGWLTCMTKPVPDPGSPPTDGGSPPPDVAVFPYGCRANLPGGFQPEPGKPVWACPGEIYGGATEAAVRFHCAAGYELCKQNLLSPSACAASNPRWGGHFFIGDSRIASSMKDVPIQVNAICTWGGAITRGVAGCGAAKFAYDHPLRCSGWTRYWVCGISGGPLAGRTGDFLNCGSIYTDDQFDAIEMNVAGNTLPGAELNGVLCCPI